MSNTIKNKQKERKSSVLNAILSSLAPFVSALLMFAYTKVVIQFYGDDLNGVSRLLVMILSYFSLVNGGISLFIISSLYSPIRNEEWDKVDSIISSANKYFKLSGLIFIFGGISLGTLIPFLVKSTEYINYSFLYAFSITLILPRFIDMFFNAKYVSVLYADNKRFIRVAIGLITSALTTLCAILFLILTRSNSHLKIITSNINGNQLTTKTLEGVDESKKWMLVYANLITFVAVIFNLIIYKILFYKRYNQITFASKDKFDFNFKKAIWTSLSLEFFTLVLFNTDEIVIALSSYSNDDSSSTLAQISIYAMYVGFANTFRVIIEGFIRSVKGYLGKVSEDPKKSLNKITFFSVMLSGVVLINGSIVTPFIVNTIFASKKTVGYFQPLLGAIVCLNTFLFVVRLPHVMVQEIDIQYKKLFWPSFIEAMLNLSLSLTLIWFFGIWGIVCATSIALVYRLVHNAIIDKKHFSKLYASNLLMILIFSASIFIGPSIMVGCHLGYNASLFDFINILIVIGLVNLFGVLALIAIINKFKPDLYKNIKNSIDNNLLKN